MSETNQQTQKVQQAQQEQNNDHSKSLISNEPTIMQSYVNDFYTFMRNEFIKYFELVNDNDKSITKFKSFMDYWCYRLYGDYGVKRKIHCYGVTFTDEEKESLSIEQKKWYTMIYGPKMNSKLLLQFFYDKSIPSYNKSKSITRLCRHMIFDMDSFSIVSLGVLKSLDEDDFYSKIKSFKNETTNNDEYHVAIEEFLEGTMVIYNHAMTKFNYHTVTKAEIEETDDKQSKPSGTSKQKNFMVATRRKIGTSFFNKPGKTFYEMFVDNNESSNFDFSKVDETDLNSICLVFNVEHTDNRIIKPSPENKNTLVAAYIIKPTECNKQIISDSIIPVFKLTDDKTKLMYNDKQILEQYFHNLSNFMVTETSVQFVQQTFKEKYDVNISVPKTISMLQDTQENINKAITTNLTTLDKYSPGFMIRDYNSSMRYKVRKEYYNSLLELKGHYPISIHDKNKDNLFKCYWRLRQKGQLAINKFLKVFDNTDKEYRQLFEEFKKEIHGLTHKLYLEYMSVFVDKEKHAREIPYLFAPLIGDLHTEYKKTKQPTTKQRVVSYINSLPVYKVYWRIFNPEFNNTDKSKTDLTNKSSSKEQSVVDVNSTPVDINSTPVDVNSTPVEVIENIE